MFLFGTDAHVQGPLRPQHVIFLFILLPYNECLEKTRSQMGGGGCFLGAVLVEVRRENPGVTGGEGRGRSMEMRARFKRIVLRT